MEDERDVGGLSWVPKMLHQPDMLVDEVPPTSYREVVDVQLDLLVDELPPTSYREVANAQLEACLWVP